MEIVSKSDQDAVSVKSYNQYSNHNMRRPVVKSEIVDFMRHEQAQLTDFLGELEAFAHRENVPIIPHETVVYFQFLLAAFRPKRILEVGTAIGFSALLMAQSAPDAKVTTIERNPEMAELARKHFKQYDLANQIELIEGDANDLLSSLTGTYDFAFMDSAKSKYIVFLPNILARLSVGGIIVIDDVFQGGDVAKPIEEVKRNQRGIYRGLHKLFAATLDTQGLTATLVPLGDGILLIRKDIEHVEIS